MVTILNMISFQVAAWHTILCIGIFTLTNARCNELYFPMGNVDITVPIINGQPITEPLVVFNALPVTASSTSKGNISYTFTGSKFLQLASTNGTLTFSPLFYNKLQRNDLEITGSVSATDISLTEPPAVETKLRVLVKVQGLETNCDLITTELCFWNSVTYQLYENRPPMDIGTLGSPYLLKMCPLYRVSYNLLNGTEQLSLVQPKSTENHWTLRNVKSLERDIHRSHALSHQKHVGDGSTFYFGVQCIVASPTGTKRDLTQTFKLNILDENDNAPKPQYTGDIQDVQLSDDDPQSLNEALEKLSNLIFVDRDSQDVNNYSVKLLNDDLHLFKLTSQMWVDDRHNEHQTVIHFKINAEKDAIYRMPRPSYNITIHVNDTKLLPNNGDSSANITIRFWLNGIKQTTPKLKEASYLRRNILFPENVTIFRTAAPLARVAQAREDLQQGAKQFSLAQDSSAVRTGKNTFNVTVKQGIVYVQNITNLRSASNPITLEIQWQNISTKEILSDLLIVYLETETNPTCLNINDSLKEWKHCAYSNSSKSCSKLCGFGTGGKASVDKYTHHGKSRCMWRGSEENGKNTLLTSLYSTCTPDTTTCPDSKCDALEELHPKICPQDCATNAWIGEINPETNRGLKRGRGICQCDTNYYCYCSVENKNVENVVTKTSGSSSSTAAEKESQINVATNISRHTSEFDETGDDGLLSCGTPCVAGITAGAVFLLAAIATIVACWHMNSGTKGQRRERKYAHNVNAINGLYSSDYIDRNEAGSGPNADGLLFNFDPNAASALGYVSPKMFPIVDAKWEFPREKLRIEQTLGEGEFGRVLRAKAFEIAGMSGFTTVAVKMLKEDARDTELHDLISEYKLLKEVSHPNVIRLLGASSLPGGPFYLIIEFAEHGSLRNYLRRSRHLESENRVANTSFALIAGETSQNDPSSSIQHCFKVTPRDILSFAWQISKGMAYLNDMKLVHRDLAARNILLADGMVCKISDFGLTRDVYEDDTYLKRTKGRVPVKWMALESLADHIYNSKSDVWSFGILLWELVTLGASPYPGIAVQNLFHLLRSGFRMEKPENCSPVLYKIMRSCWNECPGERPTFRNIALKFERMLEEGVDYLDLNPQAVHNRTYFTSVSDTDVLFTNDETEPNPGYGNLTFVQPDKVNLMAHANSETKCAEVDKLQVLWKRPDSPKTNTNSRNYENENEEKAQELHHYETPIKIRKKDVNLKTPTNERPQSYIDMAGAPNPEKQTLLRSKSKEEFETVSKITSL